MSNLKSPYEIPEVSAIAQHLPLVDISGGVMIFRDDSMAVGFSLTAPTTGLLPDEARLAIYEGVRTALATLPPGASAQVHFGQESRPSEIEPLLGTKADLPPLIRQAIDSRSAYIIEGLRNARLRKTTVDLYISIPPVVSKTDLKRRVTEIEWKISMEGPSRFEGLMGKIEKKVLRPVEAGLNSFFHPLGGVAIYTLDEYVRGRDHLMNVAQTSFTSLQQAGLNPQPLMAADVLQRYYRRWNPSKFAAGGTSHAYDPNSSIPVPELFLASPMDWDPSGKRVPKGMIYLDGYYHQLLTMHMPPDPISFPHFEELGLFAGLNCMDIAVNITLGDTVKRLKDLDDEKKAILNNNKDERAQYKLNQLSREIQELGSGEEKVWAAQHVFIIRGKDPEQLRKSVSEVISTAKRAESAEISEEIHYAFGYWMDSMPGWSRAIDTNRHNVYNTRQLVASLPIFGSGFLHPNKRVGAILETADGGIQNIFIHDREEMSAPNLLILGAPGKGKSVVANTLFTQLSRYQPRLTIVDIGSSYKRLCECLGGAFVRYDVRSADCRINPFDIFSAVSSDSASDEMQAVILLLEKMVQEKTKDGMDGLKRAERAAIEDALTTLIRQRNGKTFYLREFRETLQGFGSKVANDLASRLAPFVTGGTYASLFDGATTVPTGTRLTVFELYHLQKNSPELLPVVFQVILQHIMAMATNYPNDMKILGMDEAHQLLIDPVMRKFIELAFRTFRKLDVGIVGISQGVNDWVLPENPKAILNIVSAILALGQSPEGMKAIGEIYQLSANEIDALQHLQTIHGVQSDVMAIRFTPQGRRMTLCVNRLQPIEYAMFTTDPEDTRVLARMEARGLTISQATAEFARRYPNGIMRAGGPIPEDRTD